jgi:hypothetical protein
VIARLIGWWLSAPVDTKAAIALIVVPWLLMADLILHLPPPHH